MMENHRNPTARIEVPLVAPSGLTPQFATDLAAGADLRASLAEPLVLGPGDFAAVPTGLRMAIPPGFEGQVRPRSGLAAKHGVTVLNAPGTIDADYRGEVRVVLINHGKNDFTIQPGERIAQLVIAPCVRAEFVERQSIDDTLRGAGGFGSTGSS